MLPPLLAVFRSKDGTRVLMFHFIRVQRMNDHSRISPQVAPGDIIGHVSPSRTLRSLGEQLAHCVLNESCCKPMSMVYTEFLKDVSELQCMTTATGELEPPSKWVALTRWALDSLEDDQNSSERSS